MPSPETVSIVSIFADHTVPIATLGGTTVVSVLSGGTVYYADNPTVTASQNQGSIAAGAAVSFTSPQWARSASYSQVQLTMYPTPPAPPAPVQPSGDSTGVADTAAIQAAINQAQAGVYPFEGGVVNLGVGVFFTNAPLVISADNITLRGVGPGNPFGNKNTNANPQQGGTIITPVASFSGSNIVQFGQVSPTRTLAGCQLKGLAVDGALLAGSQVGVFWQVEQGVIKDIFVSKCPGNNVVIDGNSSSTFPNGAYDNHITNLRSNQAGGKGLVFQNAATDNMSSGIVVTYAGNAVTATSDGVFIDSTSPSNRFDSTCYVYSCGGKGFNVQNAMETKIIGARIQDVNGGVYINAGSNGHGGFQIVDCTLRNCSATTDGATDAINLTGSVSTGGGIISNNHFQTDQGNTNGTAGGNQFNRPNWLMNIASANMHDVIVGPYSYGSTGSGYGAGSGYALAGNLLDSGSNTVVTGAVGQSGFPEMKLGTNRFLFRAGAPNGAVTAVPGSFLLNTSGGHGTAMYAKESTAGNTGWVPVGSLMHRKNVVTATPSATANTNGTTQTTSPSTDYFSFRAYWVRLVSGGTFGAETLTVNVSFNFSDSTAQTFSTTFTASGTTYDLTNGNLLVNAIKDGVFMTSVGVNCQSTISSSTANVAATIAAVNG